MSIDYATRLSNLITIFDNHNTTTASPDLSGGLTRRVVQVINDWPGIQGVRGDRTPSLFVSLNNASEVETQIGNFDNRKKQKDITFDIHGVYKREGFSQEHSAVIVDFQKLAENVEAVIKKEGNTFDANVVNVELVDTDFKGEQPENTYHKVFKILLQVRYIYV